MEAMNFHLHSPIHPPFTNTPFSPFTPPLSSTTRAPFNLFATTSSAVSVFTMPEQPIIAPHPIKPPPKPKTSKAVSLSLLKDLYLDSLSTYPESELDPDSEWVLGIDPDICGALAVIRPDRTVEVFDAPHVKVPVGKSVRRRLDAKSIVKLIQSFNAPIGTSVYLEQSMPCPQDGKQGWWCMGLGYGMWIGILVASGFSVIPVSSMSWKNEFQLPGSRSGKDASRELASALFPSVSSLLKRKKDHGRAEALLIAAYGKGLKLMSRASSTVESKSL